MQRQQLPEFTLKNIGNSIINPSGKQFTRLVAGALYPNGEINPFTFGKICIENPIDMIENVYRLGKGTQAKYFYHCPDGRLQPVYRLATYNTNSHNITKGKRAFVAAQNSELLQDGRVVAREGEINIAELEKLDKKELSNTTIHTDLGYCLIILEEERTDLQFTPYIDPSSVVIQTTETIPFSPDNETSQLITQPVQQGTQTNDSSTVVIQEEQIQNNSIPQSPEFTLKIIRKSDPGSKQLIRIIAGALYPNGEIDLSTFKSIPIKHPIDVIENVYRLGSSAPHVQYFYHCPDGRLQLVYYLEIYRRNANNLKKGHQAFAPAKGCELLQDGRVVAREGKITLASLRKLDKKELLKTTIPTDLGYRSIRLIHKRTDLQFTPYVDPSSVAIQSTNTIQQNNQINHLPSSGLNPTHLDPYQDNCSDIINTIPDHVDSNQVVAQEKQPLNYPDDYFDIINTIPDYADSDPVVAEGGCHQEKEKSSCILQPSKKRKVELIFCESEYQAKLQQPVAQQPFPNKVSIASNPYTLFNSNINANSNVISNINPGYYPLHGLDQSQPLSQPNHAHTLPTTPRV
ncbi:MAG: hypothetical protein JO149_06885 [Gammaproteobacteria bacterium]|nr:hypothetical protein [Gammaproteobacteria bacterium]